MTIPTGSIARDAREALIDELTGTMLRWEGAPDTEFFSNEASMARLGPRT